MSTDTASNFDEDILAADSDDEMEIVAGREELPYTQVGDWISLSGIPPESVAAYIALKMHLNRRTYLVNPGTVRLAKMLGLPRSDKVAKVIRPLVEIGAVEVKAYGMPRRNRYVVHSTPPRDYKGPTSLAQWAKIHEPEMTRERRRQADKTERMRNRRSAPVPPESWVLESQRSQNRRSASVPPKSGVQVPPDSGVHVPPESGVEPYVVEPDVVPPPTSSDEPVTSVVPKARDEEEEKKPENKDHELIDAARSVLRRATTGLPMARMPSKREADRLITMTISALRCGWSANQLAARIGDGDLSQSRSVYAVLSHRLTPDTLGHPPAPVRASAGSTGAARGNRGDADWRKAQQCRRQTDGSGAAREFLRAGGWRDGGTFDAVQETVTTS